jgi:hypothetical protein
MSLRYEWNLSLWLAPEVPQDELDELAWHLGLHGSPPLRPTLDLDRPCFALDPARLPGGESAVVRGNGVFARFLDGDDNTYEVMTEFLRWLGRRSATDGLIGSLREELGLAPWLLLYAQAGRAYAGEPGEPPQALEPDAPAFSLTQTRPYQGAGA